MSTTAPTDRQLTDGADSLSAEEVIARMVERFHPRLVLASSFQQEESVMIDLLMRVEPNARIFTLDTGVLFPETYETWKAIEQRYDVEIEAASRHLARRAGGAVRRGAVGARARPLLRDPQGDPPAGRR